MIPLCKLEKLPRTQKLRKIAKVLGMAENRLLHWKNASGEKYTEIFSAAELVFFADSARLLAGDSLFAKETQKIFTEAANFFGASVAAHGSISHKTTSGDKSIIIGRVSALSISSRIGASIGSVNVWMTSTNLLPRMGSHDTIARTNISSCTRSRNRKIT